ncbi:MAG: hypothetical protein M1541_14470 [Acidobacteria bacterium]|nr:hypothetical protein [Acidobacteriota bacterium]
MNLPSIDQLRAIEQKARVDDATVRAAMARIKPSWAMIDRGPGGGIFRRGGLQVFFSVQRYDDGRVWLHVRACGRTGAQLSPSSASPGQKRYAFTGDNVSGGGGCL